MKNLEIYIKGDTTRDLVVALEEIKHKIDKDSLCGHNANDTGGYYFTVGKHAQESKPNEPA